MTKAEQFTAAAAAVVAEYEKETAGAVALFRKYRAELIEAATKQLKKFKDTYEKSAKALYNLMNDVYTQSDMYNTFHSIHF